MRQIELDNPGLLRFVRLSVSLDQAVQCEQALLMEIAGQQHPDSRKIEIPGMLGGKLADDRHRDAVESVPFPVSSLPGLEISPQQERLIGVCECFQLADDVLDYLVHLR